LGVNPGALGSPVSAALSSFATFAVGALIPLVPWFFGRGGGMAVISVALAAVAAVIVGGALARFTGKGVIFSALRQLGIAAVASGVTFGIGTALGAGH
jgi:VIT1/CCC1 family predicted Fe2+/Mn2+ transporter